MENGTADQNTIELPHGTNDSEVPAHFQKFWERGENCLVIVADSLRYDNYTNAAMPNLRRHLTDEREGFAMGTMTPPAFTAFMIGLPPFVNTNYKLLPHTMNLPIQLMNEKDYVTGLFSSNGWANPYMSARKDGNPPWNIIGHHVGKHNDIILTAVNAMAFEPESPHFTVLWSDRTHHPYVSHIRSKIGYNEPRPAEVDIEHEKRAQTKAAEYLDYELGFLLDRYHDVGGGNLLFFADHGEYMGDGDPTRFGHGIYYPDNDAVMRVPVCVGYVK